MFSPTKPQTVSTFFAGVIIVGGGRLAIGEMSFHLFCLVVLLIQSVYPNDQWKSVCRPSWLINILQSLGLPIIPFHNKNGVSVLIHPVKIHLTVGTRAVLQTNGTISSPHLGFGIQINHQKKSIRSPYQVGRHPNDQWKSVWWVPTAERRCGNSKYPAKKY